MVGTTGWYRKDFRLPQASEALAWVVRFESVNYRAQVWLNGRPVGSNRGAYLPFEVRLSGLKRRGTNRLVVRVDNRRYPTDFPPSGLSRGGHPSGGWWNYGGLLREVYLRRVNRMDIEDVLVRPELACASCPATVRFRTKLRNLGRGGERVRVRARFGGREVSLGTKSVGRGSRADFTGSLRIAKPRLWSPGRPHLYPVTVTVEAAGRPVARYRLRSGVRSVKVTSDGRLTLNGQYLNIRGVGLHEDHPTVGFALNNRHRERIVAETRALGATLMRAHYPLHPYMHELADKQGLLIWSEVPVYQNKPQFLARPDVRRLGAELVRRNIETHKNHASVLLWSIANELSSKPGPSQADYIRRATRLAKQLDPSRPVGIAVAGYPSAGCRPEYGPLDVIGINEYFGWYPGPNGQLADRDALSDYLDGVRACYRDKAVMVTEFGAEANRDGPVEEKGTHAHQEDFINYHLGIHGSKPWLSGSVYWALQEFRVRPGWDGGNPRPNPPIHEKGVITFSGERKPGWFELRRMFQGVQQYLPAGGSAR
jgi:beta-glucuronidase